MLSIPELERAVTIMRTLRTIKHLLLIDNDSQKQKFEVNIARMHKIRRDLWITLMALSFLSTRLMLYQTSPSLRPSGGIPATSRDTAYFSKYNLGRRPTGTVIGANSGAL